MDKPAPNNLNFGPNAMIILGKRYLKPGEDAKLRLTNVAFHVAQGEIMITPLTAHTKQTLVDKAVEWEKIFFDAMSNLLFLPNSPTLMNAGLDDAQLSACFVLPVEDDIRAIGNAITETALIHKSGGGTGFSFSKLRPKGSKVKTTGGVASGPVSFMRVFDAMTGAIKQGGTRRGANMGVLRIDHPDIREFITCKEKDDELTNFNISVAITDEFMQAVVNDSEFVLVDPSGAAPGPLVRAKELWDLICLRAWKNGDPGILFIDEVEKHNPTPHLGKLEKTNPCGEQPLLDNESCVLGSVNLAKMVHTYTDGSIGPNGNIITESKRVNWDLLKTAVETGVRFLDNVITVNTFPIPAIKEATEKTRKIGLGVMGFADMLAQLGVPYDSEKAVEIASSVMEYINQIALNYSIALGQERGLYPGVSVANATFERKHTPRNATRTTIAPTGTISTLAGAWGGIEPYFSLVYEKHVMDGVVLKEVNPFLESALRGEHPMECDSIIEQLKKGEKLSEYILNGNIGKVFKVASEIKPERHLAIQAAFQRHTDNAVSKTINLPNEATVEQISEIYMHAWKLKLKGVTVYRDGCKATQVYYSAKKEDKTKEGYMSKEEQKAYNDSVNKMMQPTGVKLYDLPEEQKPEKKVTPNIATGTRIRKKTGCGQLYVHINRNESGDPIEIFADLGKAGGCPSAFTEGLGRLASLSLKHGATLEEVRDELIEIKCSRDCGLGPNYIGSCLDGTAKAIHDCLQTKGGSNGVEAKVSSVHSGDNGRAAKDTTGPQSGACPSCGGTLDFVEGCRGGKCRNPACDYYTCG